MPPCAAPGVSESYQTPVTNLTFYLNTSYVSWQEGETMCKRNGGHLAAYSSAEEQVGCCIPQAGPCAASHDQTLPAAAPGAGATTMQAPPVRRHRIVGLLRALHLCLAHRSMWRNSSSTTTTCSLAACPATGMACMPRGASPGSTGRTRACPSLEAGRTATGALTATSTSRSPSTCPTPPPSSAAPAC
jgi:hypothetical protein